MEIAVGKQIFFVRSRNHTRSDEGGQYVTIVKVGRKWAQIENGYRFDVSSLIVDGGGYSSPGEIYESKNHFENKVATQKEWEIFRDKLQYRAPKDMTIEKIKSAYDALGI